MKRECNVIGCTKLIDSRESYCEKHRKETKLKFHKNYNEISREKWLSDIYNSKLWCSTRFLKINQDPLCEKCRDFGIVRKAEIVHHIIPIREDPSLAYVVGNLQSVCRECHEKIHRNLKGKKNVSYVR